MRYGSLIKSIKGKKILGVYGTKSRKNAKYITARFILFDDGKTFIQLVDQDCYSYHDYNTSAKSMIIIIDKDYHRRIRTMKDIHGIANMDI